MSITAVAARPPESPTLANRAPSVHGGDRAWPRVHLIVALACAAFAASSGAAQLEFVGVLSTPEKTLFALTDLKTGKTEWVAVGQTFAGYGVRAHTVRPDELTLVRSGTELRLPLKGDAKIADARLELRGIVSFGADDKMEVVRATLLYDQENVFPLKDGLVYRITPERLPDGNIRYRASIERVLAANKTERLSAPAVVTRPGQDFRLQIGDIGFAFSPRTP